MSKPEEEGEKTFPLQVPRSLFLRAADEEVAYKLGKLSASYEGIEKRIEHTETEHEKQWDQLHEEISDLTETLNDRLKKLEEAYQRVIGWMAGISAATAVIIWFVEHVILK